MYIIKKLNISLFFVLSHTHISLLLLLLLMRWRWLWLEAPRSSLCHTAIKMHSCFNKAIRAHHRFQLIQSFPLRMKLPQNCWDYFSSSAALHWRWCKFIWFLIYTCTCSRVQHTHTHPHTLHQADSSDFLSVISPVSLLSPHFLFPRSFSRCCVFGGRFEGGSTALRSTAVQRWGKICIFRSSSS